MKPLVNNDWIGWLSYERDKRGKAKLRKDTPEEIKKQYEEYLEEEKECRKIMFEDD